MITIDEAIRHCEEIAEKCDLISEASKTIKTHISCRKCKEVCLTSALTAEQR